MKSALKLILILISFNIFSIHLKAEINVGNSIEWLIVQADLVVKGNITYVDMKGERIICSIDITEGLKGVLSVTTLDFSMPTSKIQTDRLKKIMVGNKDVIIFLKNINSGKKKMSPEYTPLMDEGSGIYYIVDLNDPGNMFISASDFRVLKDAGSIIQKCKSVSAKINLILEKKKNYEFKKYYLNIPFDVEAYNVLYSGSSCYLYVPEVFFPASKSGFH